MDVLLSLCLLLPVPQLLEQLQNVFKISLLCNHACCTLLVIWHVRLNVWLCEQGWHASCLAVWHSVMQRSLNKRRPLSAQKKTAMTATKSITKEKANATGEGKKNKNVLPSHACPVHWQKLGDVVAAKQRSHYAHLSPHSESADCKNRSRKVHKGSKQDQQELEGKPKK